MNTKRQTVWLVSMLGLMVVLSAYYLFTDEVNQQPTDTIALEEIQLEGSELTDPAATDSLEGELAADAESAEAADPADMEQDVVVDGEEAAIAPEAGTEEPADAAEAPVTAEGSADATEAADAAQEGITDEEVLQQLTAEQGGEEAIMAMQMDRVERFSKEFDELTQKIASSEATDEEVAAATQRQEELMELDTRLVAFEEKLASNNYNNVVVTYDVDKDHYMVNINAPSLEKSEAVTIIKMAIEDLKISMHQISVKLFK